MANLPAQEIATHLSQALAGVVTVGRSFYAIDRLDYYQLTLVPHVTVLTRGGSQFDDPIGSLDGVGLLDFAIVGQLAVDADASGESLEDAEITLFQKIRAAIHEAPRPIKDVRVASYRTSLQETHPWGLVVVECQWRPFFSYP